MCLYIQPMFSDSDRVSVMLTGEIYAVLIHIKEIPYFQMFMF